MIEHCSEHEDSLEERVDVEVQYLKALRFQAGCLYAAILYAGIVTLGLTFASIQLMDQHKEMESLRKIKTIEVPAAFPNCDPDLVNMAKREIIINSTREDDVAFQRLMMLPPNVRCEAHRQLKVEGKE